MKRRVLILHTGGTIGMRASDNGYVPAAGFAQLLAQRLDSRAAGQLPDYDLVELEPLIDSANLMPADWRHIGRQLVDHWAQYDGFVVLHGTDTLAYTASMLSFMLRGADKPVIVTGSQIPLAELRNDALDNLLTSLILAGNYRIPEVCVCFNGRLLRGNRSTKLKSAGFDAFDSPNFPWLGQVGIHIELQHTLLLAPGVRDFRVPAFDPDAVVVLQTYPGLSARVVNAVLDSSSVRGLVLQTYGVGNPPDANRPLIAALERASSRGVTVVNITQCAQGGVSQGAYATGATLNRIGVVPGSDLTLEAAFAKLHFLIGSGLSPDEVRRDIQRPLCGESIGR